MRAWHYLIALMIAGTWSSAVLVGTFALARKAHARSLIRQAEADLKAARS